MSARVVEAVLQADITDRTPAQVIALNPGVFLNNAASSVPAHLYQSLKTIWLGASATPSQFADVVVSDLGTGLNSPIGSIVVASQRISEQVYDPSSFESDAPGAESAPIYILVYKPKATSLAIDQIQNTCLRIRYLIDNTLRVFRNQPGGIDLTIAPAAGADLTLDSRYECCYFYQGNLEPINATEATLLFNANYVRLFTK
jgi:hypothetical protein